MPDDPSTKPADVRLTVSALSAVRGVRQVFSGLSFAVAAGELLAVTGPNGAGKSTLLRVIAGLLPPADGRVALEPADDRKIGARLHYVGHRDGLKAAHTVRRNLQFWADLWGTNVEVDEALAEAGVEAFADLPVAVLSAGQRRRVALARLRVAPRPVWLLDEPATALDREAEAGLARRIGEHLAQGGMAVVATHRDLPIAPTATLSLGAA